MPDKWVIMTDLDGTFLDAKNYDYRPLLPAVQALRKAEIPIVFCSSKTRAEILPLRHHLRIHDPFIVENGGAIYVEEGYFPFAPDNLLHQGGLVAIWLGTPYADLVRALDDMELQTGCRIGRFGRAGDEELSRRTGLSLGQVALAKQREFDEPFWFVTKDPARRKVFLGRLRRLPGLRVTRGGRFYHFKGITDKGRAVEMLKGFYRRALPAVRFIGVGDSINDIPLLRAVDVPIVMRGADGRFDDEVVAALPQALQSPVAAPQGWAATVLPLVSEALRKTPAASRSTRRSPPR